MNNDSDFGALGLGVQARQVGGVSGVGEFLFLGLL